MGMTSVQVDDGLDQDVQAAAAREGVSVSDFIRTAVRERAERVLAEGSLWERIRPTVEDLARSYADERLPIHYSDPVHEASAAEVVKKHGRRYQSR